MEAGRKVETDDVRLLEELGHARLRIEEEVGKRIIGQREIVEKLLITLLADGHALLVGVPGLAKTLLVSTLAEALHLEFSRIQFTPDLMPSDITGTEVLQDDQRTGERRFAFVRGPIFADVILADEINRTPPKTQAALLEAMQEHRVTTGRTTFQLDEPFFVLATQNPIELEGTNPLPEAQLDRFMFNIHIEYLEEDDEVAVARTTTSAETVSVDTVLSGEVVRDYQRLVREVLVSEQVARYAVRLASASRPSGKDAPEFVKNWVSWGAGLRASQYLILGAKARALLDGRGHVSCDDIRTLAHPVLRHRILTTFYAEAEKITSEGIVDRLLETVPAPQSGM